MSLTYLSHNYQRLLVIWRCLLAEVNVSGKLTFDKLFLDVWNELQTNLALPWFSFFFMSHKFFDFTWKYIEALNVFPWMWTCYSSAVKLYTLPLDLYTFCLPRQFHLWASSFFGAQLTHLCPECFFIKSSLGFETQWFK